MIFGFAAFVVGPAAWGVGLACVAPLAGVVLVCEAALEPVLPVTAWGVLVVVALVPAGALVAVFACLIVLVVVLDPQPAATSAKTIGMPK